MHRRWLISRTNPEFIRHVSKTAGISSLLARILVNRGVKTPEAVNNFLYPSTVRLTDPFALPGMHAAVGRIKSAIKQQEKVFIHGDYDADGLTATAIVVAALRKAGLDPSYFVPHRMLHGYGFNKAAVDEAARGGAGLIITVDCGINSFDAVTHAKAAGIDVVITDHHEPSRQRSANNIQAEGADKFILPGAAAVVNPKLSSAETAASNLSGAGIAFRLVQALAREGVLDEADAMSLADLAALGTVADVVPLTGDNRIIMKEGLRSINSADRPGIKALREICGPADREMKAGLLSFTVVPRINAAGRISDSRDVVRLLLTDSAVEAADLSLWLDRLNSERQQIEEDVYQEALSQFNGSEAGPAIVLCGEGWHEGVLGIVASRIAEEFFKPTFVLSLQDGLAKGSARSVPSFDLCEGLACCSESLLSFGGHKQAAGLRLEAGKVKTFEKMMGDAVLKNAGGAEFAQQVEIDADIRIQDITFAVMKDLSLLEPYGFGNAEPVFGSKDLSITEQRIVGRNHLKMKLREKMSSVDAIGFDMGNLSNRLNTDDTVDVAFTPSVNEWNGRKSIQLVLKAIRPSV